MRSDCQNDTILDFIISDKWWGVLVPLHITQSVVRVQIEHSFVT